MTTLIEVWDEAHREFAIAFEGLTDEDLWKRPHPRLLSLGELAGHVAYWQAVWIMGGGNHRPELDQLPIQSLLIDHGFRYYTGTVDHPYAVNLGVQAVLDEVMRVHEAAKAFVAEKGKDEAYPGQWGTWGNVIQYQGFHVAYHTGQAYSARHLMGHETEDN